MLKKMVENNKLYGEISHYNNGWLMWQHDCHRLERFTRLESFKKLANSRCFLDIDEFADDYRNLIESESDPVEKERLQMVGLALTMQAFNPVLIDRGYWAGVGFINPNPEQFEKAARYMESHDNWDFYVANGAIYDKEDDAPNDVPKIEISFNGHSAFSMRVHQPT